MRNLHIANRKKVITMSHLQIYPTLCQLLASAGGSFIFSLEAICCSKCWVDLFFCWGKKVAFPEVTRICLDFGRGTGMRRKIGSFWSPLSSTVCKLSWAATCLLVFQTFQPLKKWAAHSGITTRPSLLAFWSCSLVPGEVWGLLTLSCLVSCPRRALGHSSSQHIYIVCVSRSLLHVPSPTLTSSAAGW